MGNRKTPPPAPPPKTESAAIGSAKRYVTSIQSTWTPLGIHAVKTIVEAMHRARGRGLVEQLLAKKVGAVWFTPPTEEEALAVEAALIELKLFSAEDFKEDKPETQTWLAS